MQADSAELAIRRATADCRGECLDMSDYLTHAQTAVLPLYSSGPKPVV